LAQFTDVALLFLRLIPGVVFLASGHSDLKNPEARQGIETSKAFAIFPGAAEVVGALAVMAGVLTQLAAIGLILVMCGSISKKIFVGTPASGIKRPPMTGVTT
jgi:putative oxidoreductase